MGFPISTAEKSEFGQHNSLIRYFTRQRIANWLVLTLSLSFLLGGVNLAAAATTITKTITVKAANGSNYQGALVQVVAVNPGEATENLGTIQTTPANGAVSISYQSNAYNAHLIITPPATDTTHAVAVIDLMQPSGSAITSVTLKAATFFLNPQIPDGSAVPNGTQVGLTANLGDRGGYLPYRVARAGAFGVAIPSNAVVDRDYHFNIYANMPATSHLYGVEYAYWKKSDGTVVVTDSSLVTELTKTSGAYVIKLQQSKLRGSLKKADGTAYTVSTGQYLEGGVKPVLASGDYDTSREQGGSQFSANGEFALTESLSAGKYLVSFYDGGTSANPMPAFDAGLLYVDAQGKFSTTENGTYTTTLDLSYTVPTTGLTTFKILDSNGSPIGVSTGFYATRTDTTFGKHFSFNQITDSNGIASARFANGKYSLTAYAGNNWDLSKSFELTVTEAGTSLKANSDNSAINKVSGNYELRLGQTNFALKIVSPVDNVTPLSDALVVITKGSKANGDSQAVGKLSITDANPIAKTYLADGTYTLSVRSNWNDMNNFIDQDYVVVKSGSTITVTKGSSVISAVNGIYTLTPGLAQISGRVLGSNGTSLIRDVTVYLSSPTAATGNYLVEAYTNTDGAYKFDLPDNFVDGTYRLQAQAQPNSGQGKSEYVSVTVTNGFATSSPDLQLRAPNVTGTLSGPIGVSPFNYIFVAKEISTNVYDTDNQMELYVDESGQYSTYLDQGKYQITSNSDYQLAGGVAGAGTICTVPAAGSAAVVCDVALAVPNVTGAITVGGVKAQRVNVLLWPTDNSTTNSKLARWSGWSESTNYGLTMPAGSYRMYISYQKFNDGQVTVPGPTCIVPTSGSVTCNAALPQTNLQFNVKSFDGGTTNRETYLTINLVGSNSFSTCCTNTRGETLPSEYAAALLDGEYRLAIINDSRGSYGSNVNYLVTIASGAVTSMKREGTSTQETATNGIYNLKLAQPQVVGTVYKTNGSFLNTNGMVEFANSSKQLMQYLNIDNTNGKFYGVNETPYADGDYYLRAVPSQQSLTSGSSSWQKVTISGGLGPQDIRLDLNIPNLTGIVSSASGPVSGITVSAVNKANGSQGKFGNAATDSDGKFGFFLETGTYQITAAISEGLTTVVTTTKECSIGVDTATAVTCNIALDTPNVSGILKVGTTIQADVSVTLNPAPGLVGNTASGSYRFTTTSSGQFAVKAPAGTYRIELQGVMGGVITNLVGPRCVVPTTGSVTCNVDLPSANFKYQLFDIDDTMITNTAVVTSFTYVGGGDKIWLCCTVIGKLPGTTANLSLLDGTYYFNLQAQSSNLKGVAQSYSVIVSNGLVTSVIASGDTVTATATNEIYSLKLRKAGISGIVYKVDGTTPAPNVRVCANGSLPSADKYSTCTDTDSSGAYKLSPPAETQQITWKVSAYGVPKSLTEAASAEVSVTTINGLSSAPTNLTLRAPNVTGAVSGPTGNSKDNYIYVHKVVDGKNVNTEVNFVSLADGKFAFRLGPGTYRLQAQDDFANVGGLSAFSELCVIESDTATAITCNISLTTPNVTGSVAFTGKSVTNYSVLLRPANGIAGNTASGWNGWQTLSAGKFGFKLVAGTYIVMINQLDATGNYITIPGPLCVVPSSGSVTCDVSMPAANLNFEVKSGEGANLVNSAQYYLDKQFGSQMEGGMCCAYTNKSTLNSIALLDGAYQLRLSPSSGWVDGAAVIYKFDVLNGAIGNFVSSDSATTVVQADGKYVLPLKKLNISGIISGPSGVAADNAVYIYKLLSDGSSKGEVITLRTDATGKYAAGLTAGKYSIQALNPNFSATGGVTTFKECTIESDTATAIICDIALSVPNVTGTVKVNNVVASDMYVLFQPANEVAGNTANTSYGWIQQISGAYRFLANPGTYRMFLNGSIGGQWGAQPVGLCVVPTSGNVVCDVNLPATNLKLKVNDSDGTTLTANNYLGIGFKTPNGYADMCCSYPRNDPKDGLFTLSLIDGVYQIWAGSWSSSTKGLQTYYTFEVVNGVVGKMLRKDDTSETGLTGDTYILALRGSALTGTVYKPDNTTTVSNIQVCATESGNDKSGTYCATSDSAGIYKIQPPYSDKSTIWNVYAQGSSKDFNLGKSASVSVTVVKGVGDKVANLVMRSPNLTGVVTGPNGASPNNYISARVIGEGGNENWFGEQVLTNSIGKFGYYLEPGRYRFYANSDMAVAGGTYNSSDICIVSADTATSTTCNISLKVPNVSGTINLGGVKSDGYIEFIGESSNEYFGNAGLSTDGSYFYSLTPGVYRLRVYLYSTQSAFIGPTCTIPTSGSVTCSFEIPSENLSIKINDASGNLMKEGVNFYLEFKAAKTNFGFSGTNSYNKDTGVRNLRLTNGTYRLVVSPNSDKRSSGSYQVYEVIVTSGAVSSIKLENSNSTLSATAGVYTLTLSAASAAGNVVAPNGSTPVPGALVFASGEKMNTNEWTDGNGYFAFAKLSDGTYTLVAYPAYGDATKGQSVPASVTVTNGLGSNDLKLTLRAPNVTGVIRGPSGVAKGAWVSVERLEAGQYWAGVQKNMSVMTSPEGNYAFNLDPGTYRFRTSGNLSETGGAPTVSDNCIVPSSGTVTCDITLLAPNLVIRVVAPGETTWNQGSWAYINYSFNKEEVTVKNLYPNFVWSKDGSYQTVLENGKWDLRAVAGNSSALDDEIFQVTVVNNVVTSVTNSAGTSISKTGNVYLLQLKSSNLIGQITFNGAPFLGSGQVSVQKSFNGNFNDIQNKWFDNYKSGSSASFGFKVEPGTYRIQARPFSSLNNDDVALGYSATCVVTETATSTCNVALQAPNLKGFVADELSQPYQYSYAYLYTRDGDNYYWNQSLNLNNGNFSTYLQDGLYDLAIYPYWEKRALYTENRYSLRVENGVITGAFNLASGDTVTAVSGRYPFKLGIPSVKGKVVAPGVNGAALSNIQVQLGPVGSSKGYWSYGTSTDENGIFALSVPDGTYQLQAIPQGGGFLYGKSAAIVITVNGGVVTTAPAGFNASSLTLVLREPNLTGRVVTPGANPQPLANVNVNIWVDGEYLYSWTNADGKFAVFVENATPNCVNGKGCQISLNYYKSADYTPKQFAINGIGNRGDLAIGGVSTRLTVLAPQASGPALPSKYSWVSVEKIESNGSTSWVTSGSTNESGVIGLSLDDGANYLIWAYPNYEKSGQLSATKLTVNSFAAATMPTLSLTFPTPNLLLTVKGSDNSANVWGWYLISNWDSVTAIATQKSSGTLDQSGKGALTLEDGTYQILIWPGKSTGVTKTIIVTVTSGVARVTEGNTPSDVIADGNVTLKLAAGNISGVVKKSDGSKVESAIVAAYESGTSLIVSTATDKNGYYELNLNLNSSWTVKAIDPETSALGSAALASRSPSNAVVANVDISLAAGS